jgi:hypothetical protein
MRSWSRSFSAAKSAAVSRVKSACGEGVAAGTVGAGSVGEEVGRTAREGVCRAGAGEGVERRMGVEAGAEGLEVGSAVGPAGGWQAAARKMNKARQRKSMERRIPGIIKDCT